jgi:hypothetical protein
VVGVLASRLLPSGQLQVKRLVDADCQPTQVEEINGGAPVESLQGGINYLIAGLAERAYIFQFQYDGAYILITFESS